MTKLKVKIGSLCFRLPGSNVRYSYSQGDVFEVPEDMAKCFGPLYVDVLPEPKTETAIPPSKAVVEPPCEAPREVHLEPPVKKRNRRAKTNA